MEVSTPNFDYMETTTESGFPIEFTDETSTPGKTKLLFL